MKTKLVTAFYTDIIGFPFFGHESFARHERYLHSLRTLNNMNTEIICYCNDTQYNLLTEYCKEFKASFLSSENPGSQSILRIANTGNAQITLSASKSVPL